MNAPAANLFTLVGTLRKRAGVGIDQPAQPFSPGSANSAPGFAPTPGATNRLNLQAPPEALSGVGGMPGPGTGNKPMAIRGMANQAKNKTLQGAAFQKGLGLNNIGSVQSSNQMPVQQPAQQPGLYPQASAGELLVKHAALVKSALMDKAAIGALIGGALRLGGRAIGGIASRLSGKAAVGLATKAPAAATTGIRGAFGQGMRQSGQAAVRRQASGGSRMFGSTAGANQRLAGVRPESRLGALSNTASRMSGKRVSATGSAGTYVPGQMRGGQQVTSRGEMFRGKQVPGSSNRRGEFTHSTPPLQQSSAERMSAARAAARGPAAAPKPAPAPAPAAAPKPAPAPATGQAPAIAPPAAAGAPAPAPATGGGLGQAAMWGMTGYGLANMGGQQAPAPASPQGQQAVTGQSYTPPPTQYNYASQTPKAASASPEFIKQAGQRLCMHRDLVDNYTDHILFEVDHAPAA